MLIVAKRVKPNRIKLYRWAFDEIESYSLLKVSVEEAKELIRADKDGWKTFDNSGIKEYTHVVTEAINTIWLKLAAKHKENNPNFFDVSKKYKYPYPGTSCIIRNSYDHSIRIAYRNRWIKPDINITFITDKVREMFFKDSHHSFYWKVNKKYGISVEDEAIYYKWSKFMNDMYVKYTTNKV